MLLTTVKGALRVVAETYSLTLAIDRPFVYVDDPQGKRLMELFVLSSVHPLQDRDDTVCVEGWEVQETDQEILLSLRAGSSAWEGKTYRLICRPRRFLYDIEICGSGRLSEVNYFGGYASNQPRWGSGFFPSGQHFQRGFNAEPNAAEMNEFEACGNSSVGLMGVPLPGKSDWFFTPPPFWFEFQGEKDWIGMGVEAQAGANRFTEYRYHGGHGCFYLSLSYEGHTEVRGRYRLPGIPGAGAGALADGMIVLSLMRMD